MTQQLDAPADVKELVAPSDVLAVGVVGLGYVGLPTAIALAAGSQVVGVDVSARRLAAIGKLRVDLPTAELAGLRAVFDSGALTLTDDIALLAGVDGIIICVPTPVDST